MRKIFGLVLLLSIAVSAQPVVLKNLYKKVERKIAADKKYLDLYYVQFQPSPADLEDLRNIPRGEDRAPFNFQSRENIRYDLVFIKEGVEVDSAVILYIRQIEEKTGADSGLIFGGAAEGPSTDTTMPMRFSDMQELFFNHPSVYAKLYNRLQLLLKADDPVSLLGIRVEEKVNKSRGITSADNRDFLNFQRVNSIHRYPRDIEEAPKKSKRQKTAEPESKEPYQIDASFSQVSFYHEAMNFGFSTISAELSTGARVLNVLPYESMSLSLGIRSLISIGGDMQNLKNGFLLDAKLMGRMRLNTASLAENLPFFSATPLLNVGSAFILDVQGSRAFDLPFFNLYLATGVKDFTNPYVKSGKPDSSTSFFTTHQWEASLSFYWNTSEDLTMRFRMDLGVANHDVWRAVNSNGITTKLESNKILPVLALHMNFAPKNVEFFGSSFRFYDNILNVNFWLKLLELGPTHVFRFEAGYMTSPMFRALKPWEAEGGKTSAQIRYRFGF